ncbi:MAG: serine--tRNA ligase [Phycisphaerae bacterium]|nr:serine--tRNA ligase [Phycisphaerae bacterium]MDW8262965.1 serine--tRNA ligase [Phycisphaerales bacterium]
MLDPKLIRDHPEAVRQAARLKGIGSPELVDAWLAADEQRRLAQAEADALRAEQGRLGAQVGKLKGQLKGGTSPELESLLQQATRVKERYEQAAARQAEAEAEARRIMLQLPAIPDPSWPVGTDATQNKVVRTWDNGQIRPVPLGTGRRSHIELGTDLGILDFDRGVKLAGSRSYVVRGAGALLYHAVLRFAMDVLTARGYEPFVVPVLVTEKAMEGTGYFPAGRDQAYITQDQSVLVGTSEVSLASFYGGEILEESLLPQRMCALSTCFRREAGAAGKDTAGLYRVHQFDKVEQVVVHAADEAEHIRLHEEIMANSEHILQQLGLPYRVVQNCTGDMGQGKWRMYDIETWMPSRNEYGETHSGSALKDFQSRRLNLRYRKTGEKQPAFCYTLNNTAIACPRILIAILENYQNTDGSVSVPPVLRPYMNGIEQIRR